MKRISLCIAVLLLFAIPAVHADFWDFLPWSDPLPTTPGFDPTDVLPTTPGFDPTDVLPTNPGFDPTDVLPTNPTDPIFTPTPFDPVSYPGDIPMDPNDFNPNPGNPVPFPPNNPIPANLPPVLTAIGSRTVFEGQLLTFAISGADPEGQALSFSASNLPSGASFSSQIFSWTSNFNQQGSYVVIFGVTDNTGQQDIEAVQIAVLDVSTPPPPPPTVNHAPVFLSTPVTSAFIREWYFSPVIVFDADGDNVALSLGAAPAGMSLDYIDSGYTVFSSFIDEGDTEAETAITGDTFTVTVHDVAANNCDITINDRHMTFNEDVNYLIVISGVQYAVTVEPDMGFGDCYVNIEDNRVVTGWIYWLPEPTQVGSNAVSILANDGHVVTAQNFNVTVTVDPRTFPKEDEPKAPRKDVRINTIALPEEAYAGDVVIVTLNFENSGDLKLDSAEATISIPELGIRSPTIGPLDLRIKKDVSRSLVLEIPSDAPDGLYTVRVTIDSGSVHRVVHRDIEIVS